MSVPTVPVTCIASDNGGNPVVGAIFRAELDKTETYQGYVVPETVEAIAGADGIAILNLWPNTLGVSGSLYRVVAFNPDNRLKFLDTKVSVPDSPCNLHEIATTAPPPALDAALQAMLAAQAAVLAAQEAAALAIAQADIAIAKANEISAGADVAAQRFAKAGEALGGHRCVLLNAMGEAFYADCSIPAHFGRLAGITNGATAAGDSTTIIRSGVMSEPAWSWIEGAPVFLGQSGLLTQAAPNVGFQQVIGIALSPGTIFISPREPVFTI